jgi:hypothetical protein
VRVLDPVQHYEQLRVFGDVVEFGVLGGRAVRNDTLVRLTATGAVERGTGLESNQDVALATQVYDLLDARPTGSFRDQYLVDGTTGAQSLTYRVDAD